MQSQTPRRPPRRDEHKAAKPQPNDLGTPFRCRGGPLVSVWPSGFCPGGTPEEISRGQVRARGRRPRNPCRGSPCPSGASKKWREMLADPWRPALSGATSGDGDAAGRATPKTSPMPRWGMARSAWEPGAAPAGTGLPPANFLRRPSGAKDQASATIFRLPRRCQCNGKILAGRADFEAL